MRDTNIISEYKTIQSKKRRVASETIRDATVLFADVTLKRQNYIMPKHIVLCLLTRRDIANGFNSKLPPQTQMISGIFHNDLLMTRC